jgi:hypothetical protein
MSSKLQLLKNRYTLPEDLSPYSVEYFGEKYYQVVRVYRQQDTQDTSMYMWYMYNDYVEKIEIISDLLNPVLNGSIIFNDIGNQLFNKLNTDDCRTYVEVTLLKIGEDPNDIQVEFSHVFFAMDVEEISKNHLSVSWEIHLISGDWAQFNNTLNYASREVMPYTEMIQAVFSKMKLKFVNIKNTTKNLINNIGTYTAAANYPAYDTLMSLLNKTPNNDNGFLMLRHEMVPNQYSVISPKLAFAPESLENIAIDNVLNVPTEDMVAPVPRTANEISEKNYLNINENFDKLKGVKIHDFDYDSRKWVTRKFEAKAVFSDFLPVPKLNTSESKFKPLEVQLDQAVRDPDIEYLRQDFNFRDHLQKIFMLTDVIEFKCYGVIERSAGDMLSLFCAPSHPLYTKYNGPWMITRVYHRIVKKEYVNVIQACRTHQFNDKLRIESDLRDGER